MLGSAAKLLRKRVVLASSTPSAPTSSVLVRCASTFKAPNGLEFSLGRSGGATYEVTDPANGDVLASVPDMDAAEARAAVAEADQAFKAWGKTLAKDRAAILERMFTLMHDHSEDLAHVMTVECGKPLAEARGEVGPEVWLGQGAPGARAGQVRRPGRAIRSRLRNR